MLRLEALTARRLAPLDLTVEGGSCVTLTGTSGAGKTVLLRAIADLDPNQGDAVAGDMRRSRVPAPEWRRQVGYLAAEPGWWNEHVGDHFQGTPGTLLDDLGLPREALDWEVRIASTGERQRLALARLLERWPRVLLLDEPSAGLDAEGRDRVEALIRRRLSDGASVLLVTHDPAQADRMGDRQLRVEDGAVRELTDREADCR